MTIPTSLPTSPTEDDIVHGPVRRARRTGLAFAAAMVLGGVASWALLRGYTQHSYGASREKAKPPAVTAPTVGPTAQDMRAAIVRPDPNVAAADPPIEARGRADTPVEAPLPHPVQRTATASTEVPPHESGDTPPKKTLPGAAAKSSTPSRPDRPVEAEATDLGAAPRARETTDDDAIQQALAQGAARAKGCHVTGGPTGTARVSVTFAPSGDVTGVSVGGAFANSLEGACIAAKFRALHVPAFTGADVVVRKSFSIE